VEHGQVNLDADTTIYFDEAGMGDTSRLDRLTEIVERTGAKLVAIGGELGELETQVPGVHYGIRQGDRVAMIEQHHEPGSERIENGSQGEVLHVTPAGEALIEFDITGRRRTLAGDDLARVRLGYAHHIHRAQGATVTRTVVVTGGWQASKEPAYVEASRAREGTDWFVSREDLGAQGHDTDRIDRLAQNMGRSHSQTPSLAHPELADPEYGRGYERTLAPSRSRLRGVVRATPTSPSPYASKAAASPRHGNPARHSRMGRPIAPEQPQPPGQ